MQILKRSLSKMSSIENRHMKNLIPIFPQAGNELGLKGLALLPAYDFRRYQCYQKYHKPK